jgi:hypothetical protein
MRSYVICLSMVISVLPGLDGSAHADVCVTVDEARDALDPRDRAAAVILVTREFEKAGERVVPAGCATSFSLSHAQLGNIVVVSMSGPGGPWQATALTLDDLPAVYSQMVRSIVTGRPMTGLNVVDRTNVTASQALSRRVHSDSLWYARLGYGSIFGDQAYGTPALGFGYRAELDPFAIDVSFLNFQFRSLDDYSASSRASAASLLKLSGLYYMDANGNRSPYFGGGLSYGHASFGSGSYSFDRYRTDWDGSGLQGELSAGYEIARATSLRMFVQADAVLPFYHVTSESFTRTGFQTTTDRRYAPSLVVSIGIGR